MSECLCLDCRGVELPEQRVSEGHVGVRFGHMGPEWSVTLDGEQANQVFEALGGRDGWVAAYHLTPHICPRCREDACALVHHGAVQVSRVPA